MLFPSATLDAIEQAIGRAEQTHAGEIRFAIETSLTPQHILNDVGSRARALEVFAHLRVWDTEHNNGALIYVQMADRSVEIVPAHGGALPGRAVQNRLNCRSGCHRQSAEPPFSPNSRPNGPIT
jgi:uncharacterized membrane protein